MHSIVAPVNSSSRSAQWMQESFHMRGKGCASWNRRLIVFVKVDFIICEGIVNGRQKPELPEQGDEAATSKGKSDAKTENPNAMFENQILEIGNPNAKTGQWQPS